MNILLVEDRGEAAYPLQDSLEAEGYSVFVAPNIPRAKFYWREEKISCLIVDLNMQPDGLTPEEIKQTLGGLLTGWIWLQNYVFARDESVKKRTIILTAYVKELKKELREKTRLGELDGIAAIISKDPAGQSDTGTVLTHVKAIRKMLEGGNLGSEK